MLCPGHRIYRKTEKKKKDSFVSFIVMDKLLEDNSIAFDSKSENKVTYMDSFVFTRVMPEIFEMLNRNFVAKSNLADFFLTSLNKTIFFLLSFPSVL